MKTLFPVLAAIALPAASYGAWQYSFAAKEPDDAPAVSAPAAGDVFAVEFPDGAKFELRLRRRMPSGVSRAAAFYAEDAESGATAVVKRRKDGSVSIFIDDFPNGLSRMVETKDGKASFSTRDVSNAAPDVCEACTAEVPEIPENPGASGGAAKTKAGARLATASGDAFAVATHLPVVDILVVFDQGAKAKVESGGFPGAGETIEEFADWAVAKMNMVLGKSQLLDHFSYRCVGAMEVDAKYTKITSALVNELCARNSGALASVGKMRETTGADVITLLIDRTEGTVSGQSYEMSSAFTTVAQFDVRGYTCNVCDANTVYSRYTMSHETGHNMGCGHSDLQYYNGPGRFDYSCGYHFTDANGVRRYTIMAYNYTDRAETNYQDYQPVPYFSTPLITPEEYGVPLGDAEKHDNRRTLAETCDGASKWREHVVPYDWDVRFLDDDGNEIENGSWFHISKYVTLATDVEGATIYYTLDGTTPTASSYSCASGTKLYVGDTKTITACAATEDADGTKTAQSFRSLTLYEGLKWTGAPDGSGVWRKNDEGSSCWSPSGVMYTDYDAVWFADLEGVSAATVSVDGAVAPYACNFVASSTAYAFAKGADGAKISLPGRAFAPSGDLTFDVPVEMADVVAFTNPANHTIVFNAPFGQTLTETTGYCTNAIGIGSAGSLVVRPGAGKTQIFDTFNNTGWYYNTASFTAGEGTTVFNGPCNASAGLFGSVNLAIEDGGTVFYNVDGKVSKNSTQMKGAGTAVFKSLTSAGSITWTGADWTGTVALTNISTTTLALDKYGNAGSTVRLTGVSGYPGSCGNTNIVFDTAIELVDGADGTAALTVDNGYSSDSTTISRLRGDGTFKTTLSPGRSYVRQGFVVNDASGFTGSLDITGAQFTFGTTIRKNENSQDGTIYIDAGMSVTNAAVWKASALEVYGELVKKGTLSISDSVVFGDGASFAAGSLAEDGVALVSKAIATNGTLNVSVPGSEREYVAEIADNPDGTQSLVFKPAPLPETVSVVVPVRYSGDDGREDGAVAAELPVEWIERHFGAMATAKAVAAKYLDTAANGAPVWQCWMLGLDPTDSASAARLSMAVEDGKISFYVEGLGETHSIAGVKVDWYLYTSTDLATDPVPRVMRDHAEGLPPAFAAHPMPDVPRANASETAPSLFYRLTATFVADAEEVE